MIGTPVPHPGGEARVGITAVGAALPEPQLSTADLQDRVSRASGFALPRNPFATMTGIERRRVAGEHEYASTLAVPGARAAGLAGQANAAVCSTVE